MVLQQQQNLQSFLIHSTGTNKFGFRDSHFKFAFCFAGAFFFPHEYLFPFFLDHVCGYQATTMFILLSFNLANPESCCIYHLATNTVCSHQQNASPPSEWGQIISESTSKENHADHFPPERRDRHTR